LWSSAGTKATKRGRGNTGGDNELRRREVTYIGPSLTAAALREPIRALNCNRVPKRCFQGKIPGYDGFLVDATTARRYRADSAAVIYPYLTGRELLSDFRIERWIIDFGDRNIAEAS